MRAGTAHAHFLVGRYDEAASWAAMALQDNPDFQAGLRIDAASNAMAGRPEQAHKAVARLRQLISKTCWALIGVPKTSRVTKKDCGKPGCPNDHHSLVLAGAGEMIEQERRLPPGAFETCQPAETCRPARKLSAYWVPGKGGGSAW